MPADADDRAAALAAIGLYAPPSAEPALTEDEVGEILDGARSGSTWEAETEYRAGDYVLPTARDGKRRRAVQGGTSGETEPVWGTTDFYRNTDGTVIWEEAGPASGAYDRQRAVYLACKAKAAKSSEYEGDDEQRIHRHWVEEMKRNAPAGIA